MMENNESAFIVAFRYLKTRPRTEYEMKRHLLRWAVKYRYSPDCVDGVIRTLREQDFLNDRRFTGLFIKDRTILKPKGERVLRNELIKKGVSPEIVDEFFSAHPVNDAVSAKQALAAKNKALSRLSSRIRFQKAISFLMRRGFSYADAKQAYSEMFGTQNTFEENAPKEYNSDN